jgi:hypothetical protein
MPRDIARFAYLGFHEREAGAPNERNETRGFTSPDSLDLILNLGVLISIIVLPISRTPTKEILGVFLYPKDPDRQGKTYSNSYRNCEWFYHGSPFPLNVLIRNGKS